MKKPAFIIAFFLSALVLRAQECVTIESILVDACTLGSGCSNASAPTCNCEGKNEMLRFSVGDNDLNVADLTINWPNNAFQGICQNALTTENTSELNAAVEACGLLVEPVDGLLPAGSQVLVVTSSDMCTASNSFANLSDTLIILFQCPGNYQGHFANFGTGFRTTTVNFGPGCSSTATYDRSLLVNQGGTPGAQDGATVDFGSNINPVYYNLGCNAPVPVAVVDAGEPTQACPGDVIQVSGFLDGPFSSWFWSGGSGSFADAGNLQTTYTLGPDDNETFFLTLTAIDCNGEVTSQLEVSIPESAVPVISPEGPIELCPDQTIELTATGNGSIVWNTGEEGSTIVVSEPGTYTAELTGLCGVTQASVEVEAGDAPTLSVDPEGTVEICPDETLTLTATGNGDFLWNTGSSDSEIIVNTPGVYTVALTNSCGTVEESVEVLIPETPEITVLNDLPVLLCSGSEVTLAVSGNGDFEWNTGETSPEITVDAIGTYSVTLSNSCESVNESIEVFDGGESPSSEIVVMGSDVICAGESVTLLGVGNGEFSWSNGSSAEEIEVFLPGTYTLSVSNDCGTDLSNVTITQPTSPLVIIAQGQEIAICNDESVQLTATSTLPITWSNGASGGSIMVSETGTYYAFVENECGTDTAFIEVLDGNPMAFFTATPNQGEPPLEVFFDNESENADSYSWSINGSVVSQETDLTYLFLNEGNQTITLTASDSAGCSSSFSTTINLGECIPNVFIPNTFTPNGDGINDLFKVESSCIEEFELRIFNRWGVLLFTSQLGGPGWDGNNGSGYYVSDGVYIYTIHYTDINGVSSEENGTITIFR